MKKKAKITLLIILSAVAAVIAAWLIFWGGTRSDVFIYDQTVEDGTLSIDVGVASSMGYIRACRTEVKDGGLYLTFRSTFGPNCALCARNHFEVELPDGCTSVYVYSGGEYRLMLVTDGETGEWVSAGANA